MYLKESEILSFFALSAALRVDVAFEIAQLIPSVSTNSELLTYSTVRFHWSGSVRLLTVVTRLTRT